MELRFFRLAVCVLGLSASCSFPEVTFDTTAGGGSGATGGATTTSTGTAGSGASGGVGGTGAGGATGGHGGVGGTGAGGATGGHGGDGGGGAGGSGGGMTTSSTTSATGGSGGGTCVEDADNDTFISWCAGGPDCADEDGTTNPNADYDSSPIVGATKPNTNPYDLNCNGMVEYETKVLTCPSIAPCGASQGYEAAVACGQYGALGKCVSDLVLGCKWAPLSPAVDKQQKCK